MRTDWLRIVCVAGLMLAAGACGLVAAAEMEQEEQIMPGPPMREGRFELGPEQVEKILAQIREKDPQKADALMKLQEENPEAFMAEIRNVAREQFMGRRAEQGMQQPRRRMGGPTKEEHGQGEWPQMMRERMQERSEEYMKWLKETYPDEAAKLEQMKEENPEQYMRAMAISGKKFGPVFQASKDNPALAVVLKDQLALREKRADLLRQIRTTADEKQKKELTGELEKVVGQQFDLIVKRKQLAYEDLTKKLAELQKEVDNRKAEVEKWKGKDFKNEEVKKRVNELVTETEKFEWE